jgi:DNA-binding SARP family transcriptional activator
LLLSRAFPEIAADDTTQSYHPGVTLRIQTFGPLRVWRGNEEIGPHEWQRKKAQQMLALLITNRDRWLLREQICDRLWPDHAPEEAEAQFKVTLNGLNAALEPLRPPRTPPYYIRRRGGAYRFCPPDGVWLDVEEFESRLGAARALRAGNAASPVAPGRGGGDASAGQEQALAGVQAELEIAVELHQGEFLGDWLYEDWTRDERERLESLYLEAATQLAEVLVGRNELFEAIRLCDLVLAHDPSWEDAYCVLMRAYALQGHRRMALATYERCVRNLRELLDVEPLPSTVRIYEEVKE